MEGDVENVWWVPLTWSMTLTKKYEIMCKLHDKVYFIFSAKNVQKIIPSDHKELLRSLVRFKDGMEGVMGYDHIQVPPVYKQVGIASSKNTKFIFLPFFIHSGCSCGNLLLLWTLSDWKPGAGHRQCSDVLPHYSCPQVHLLHRMAEGGF